MITLSTHFVVSTFFPLTIFVDFDTDFTFMPGPPPELNDEYEANLKKTPD